MPSSFTLGPALGWELFISLAAGAVVAHSAGSKPLAWLFSARYVWYVWHEHRRWEHKLRSIWSIRWTILTYLDGFPLASCWESVWSALAIAFERQQRVSSIRFVFCLALRRGYSAFVHAKLARILGASSVLVERKARQTSCTAMILHAFDFWTCFLKRIYYIFLFLNKVCGMGFEQLAGG